MRESGVEKLRLAAWCDDDVRGAYRTVRHVVGVHLCEAVGELNADRHGHAGVQRRTAECRRQTLSLNMLVREGNGAILIDDVEQRRDCGVRDQRRLFRFGQESCALRPIAGDMRMYDPHKCRAAASGVARAVGLAEPILSGSLEQLVRSDRVAHARRLY